LSSLIFITGGARSGKSSLAVQLAKKLGGEVAFIATARAGDEEMAQRILIHRESRPKEWTTIEEPVNIASAIDAARGHNVAIIDCLTLLLSNLMFENRDLNEADAILGKIRALVEAAGSFEGTVLVVSNEVGMGIVPENELARKFRDLAGKANQIMAGAADEVYVCFAGIPVKIKGKYGQTQDTSRKDKTHR
jgi:adenosylcobinamide kinase/adenosylcobinamide-phosphate guanylyltransferase